MSSTSKQPSEAMMAWYRAKKFGVVRSPYGTSASGPVTGKLLIAEIEVVDSSRRLI